MEKINFEQKISKNSFFIVEFVVEFLYLEKLCQAAFNLGMV